MKISDKTAKKKLSVGVSNAHFETYGHDISQLCFIPH